MVREHEKGVHGHTGWSPIGRMTAWGCFAMAGALHLERIVPGGAGVRLLPQRLRHAVSSAAGPSPQRQLLGTMVPSAHSTHDYESYAASTSLLLHRVTCIVAILIMCSIMRLWQLSYTCNAQQVLQLIVITTRAYWDPAIHVYKVQ